MIVVETDSKMKWFLGTGLQSAVVLTISRKRDKKLEEEIRKASEEKESMVGSHGGSGRRASKSREAAEKQRLRSTNSGAESEERPGPSICPASPFNTFVS